MTFVSVARNFRSCSHYLLAALMVWLVFVVLVDGGQVLAWQTKLLFAFSNIGLTFLLLRELGYFRRLRLSPRKSDLFLLGLVTFAVALVLQALWGSLTGEPYLSRWIMLVSMPLVVAAVFGFECIIAELSVVGRPRRKVALILLSTERKQLLEDFAELGMADRLQFLRASDLRRLLLQKREREVALIIISRKALASDQLDPILVRAHIAGVPIVDHHKVSADLTGRVRLNDVDQWVYLLQATSQAGLMRFYGRLKNLLEPVAALLLGVLLLPLMVVVGVLVKLTSRGPIFYRQMRTGFLGREFMLVKFRSMVVQSEKSGPRWSSELDERVTGLGRFLRRTRLDELPQLWNIFLGEMSFIGPRPERPEFYRQLRSDIPLFPIRTVLKPGVTGWAQVCSGYASSVAESMTKLEYDLYYIKHMSPRLDLVILIKTLFVVIIGADRESLPQPALRASRALVALPEWNETASTAELIPLLGREDKKSDGAELGIGLPN